MAVAARKAGRAGTGAANKSTSSKGSVRGAAPEVTELAREAATLVQRISAKYP